MKNFLDLAETFCRQDASNGHFFRKIYHIFFLNLIKDFLITK